MLRLIPSNLRDAARRLRYRVDIGPGPRSHLLHRQAYAEEGLPYPAVRMRFFPFVLMYPRSFIERVAELPAGKVHDFCFVGALFRPDTFENRKWITDFARRRFTTASYYCVTDPPDDYVPIGDFDFTLENRGQRFVPKNMPVSERAFFDGEYFRVMCQSQFTLCPPGDMPWSMRFFESVMCRSIPVLQSAVHAGRNALERSIGYRFYLTDGSPVFNEHWVRENYDRFLARQTLLSVSAD